MLQVKCKNCHRTLFETQDVTGTIIKICPKCKAKNEITFAKNEIVKQEIIK